jgi:acetyltransferase
MSIRNLDAIFAPRSIALIGASTRASSVGAVLARNLLRGGFKGPILPVHPREAAIEGVLAYRDIAGLPLAPDLAVLATPPDTLPGLIAELGSRGTRAAVVLTAGFGELEGGHGSALQQAMLDAARPHLLRIVGPNCLGVMTPRAGVNATFAHLPARDGEIALVTQSGAMAVAVLDWAVPRGIGFSTLVSVGGMADVDFGDLLDFLALDGRTRAILLYVEAVTHARKFMSAARAAARMKPVIVVKAGRFAEGARAAKSHTGALAGADDVHDAAFRRAGMLRVWDIDELFDAAATLASVPAQRGERLAILTNGGGPGVLATDALIAGGGTLAALAPETLARLDDDLPRTWSRGNPVDIIGDADGARYAKALTTLLDDPGVDALLVANCPTAIASSLDAAKAVIAALAPREAGQRRPNVLATWLGEETATAARRLLAGARIPSYDTPERAVRAFMHLVRYRRNQDLLMETPRPAAIDPPDIAAARQAIGRTLESGAEWLAPSDARDLAAAYRIPIVATLHAADPAEARAIAARIGRPVALKIRSPDIVHKSDLGGVALNLEGPERVERVADEMLARVRAARPAARIEGFIVQEMIDRPAALELIAGLSDDPVFGPVVLFGHGGIAVEAIGDRALELPPLNLTLARAQMQRTRVWRLMQGFRNRKAVAVDLVADALVRIGQIAADHPEVVELDLNPLLADADGVVALDIRVRVHAAAAPGDARLAIKPYPRALERAIALRDGTALRLRPIRPEDEPALQDFVRAMTPEDRRMRFFAPIQELSHEFAARLTQIDYDREMALIARAPDDPAILGVARIAADPDNLRAEYAVAVRSDWKARGLGYALMQAIIDVARRRGTSEIFGDVLVENRAMLALCAELGFTRSVLAESPEIVRVSLRLS